MKLSKKQYKEIENLVYNYPTKHKEGFIWEEQKELMSKFPEINKDKYFDVQRGITCISTTEGIVVFHCDVLQSLICGLENREQTAAEWD
jgi:hypothetical protein